MLRDEYTKIFYDIVRETKDIHSLELPIHLEAYIVMLLSSFVDKPNFLPKLSFAENLLKLDKYSSLPAKDLGDICLFITGVFPTYNTSRGLDVSYYTFVGKSSYSHVKFGLNGELFAELSDKFEYLREFINMSIGIENRNQYFNLRH